MQILHLRRGFQADHSSSSYLFYAVDHPVSASGQAIAHRFSSRAEVNDRAVRYEKWGESELSFDAYKALLGKHYDVMVSESYDWWTLMIALPKTSQSQATLAPFISARGDNDQGAEVEDYGKWLVVSLYCAFQGSGVEFGSYDDDALEVLAGLLAEVRAELIDGNTSFLQAVVSFYNGDLIEEEASPAPQNSAHAGLSKLELQQQCQAQGIGFRKSWTKAQLCEALNATAATTSGAKPKRGKTRLSHAARKIIDQLEHV